MRKIIVLTAIFLLVGSLGAAVETGNGKEINILRDKVVSCCDDDADGDGIGDIIAEMLTGVEKDQVKRGMVIARMATSTGEGDNVPNGQPFLRTELKDATMGNRAENYKDFTVSKRSARKGRNPQTGKEIKIPANAGGGDDEFQEALAGLLETTHTYDKTTGDDQYTMGKKVAKFKPGAELSNKVK